MVGKAPRYLEIITDPDYREMIYRLRTARQERRLSQFEVAEMVNVSWTTLSGWERFVHTPSLFHLLAWWRALEFEAVQSIDAKGRIR